MIGADPTRIRDLSQVEALIARQRGGDSSVHAITLTLLVLAPDRACRERALSLLAGVGGSHPLRALVLTPASGEPRASVSMSCWLGGGREVCSEQVVIEAEPRALPSAAESLVAADLPVFLWWQGAVEAGGELFGRLAGFVDRLVLDGADCGLEQVRSAAGVGPVVSDLQWGRLQPWRQALAELFDADPGRSALASISRLEVVGPEPPARLLAGWLRSRLDREIELARRGAAALQRVTLTGERAFVVERGAQPGVGRAGERGGELVPVVLAARTPVAQLAAEFDRLGRDHVFEQALGAA